ncbi:MAG: MATE family efflux transporter, partial [Oscillospiraceae bacterium]|nr:MATE family efflux transporter [Oscillospiraceae bacterium]
MAQILSPEAEHKRMTESSVAGLVVKLSLPTIASQMISSVYNLADTYFVTNLGDQATGAVTIVFALQSIIQAVGFGLAMGAGSLVSRKLGEKREDLARKYATSAFFAGI